MRESTDCLIYQQREEYRGRQHTWYSIQRLFSKLTCFFRGYFVVFLHLHRLSDALSSDRILWLSCSLYILYVSSSFNRHIKCTGIDLLLFKVHVLSCSEIFDKLLVTNTLNVSKIRLEYAVVIYHKPEIWS